MKRKLAVFTTLFILCAVMFAAQPSLQELKEKAAVAERKDQPKLYVKIAEIEMKTIAGYYKNGDVDNGQAVLADLAEDCEKAASASATTRKQMKHTEIALRKIEKRLDNIAKSASFDYRSPIKEAEDRIEKARSELVEAMFAK